MAAEPAVAVALGRAGLYRLLSLGLVAPTPPRLEEVRRAAEVLAASRAEADELRTPLAALAAAAEESASAVLAEEHVFLFDRQVRCSPYEGAYGDGPHLAGKGAALADLSGFYAAFGLGAESGHGETEDHIATELEFMSALALKEAWALGEGEAANLEVTRAAQVAFVRDHLGRWGAAFADELEAATPLPYYAALATLLRAWMATEGAALGVATAPVRRAASADPLQDDTFTCPMVEPAGDEP